MGVATTSLPVGSIVGAGDATTLLYFVLPVWILGTIVGLLVRGLLYRPWLSQHHKLRVSSHVILAPPQLPRPKWLETWTRTSSLLLPAPVGLFFRRTALLCHAGLIVRFGR